MLANLKKLWRIRLIIMFISICISIFIIYILSLTNYKSYYTFINYLPRISNKIRKDKMLNEIDNWMIDLESSHNLTSFLIPESKCSSPFMTVRDMGRLGNNICEFISLFVFRLEFGVRIAVPQIVYKSLRRIFRDLHAPYLPNKCFVKDKNPTVERFDKMYKLFQKQLEITKKYGAKTLLVPDSPKHYMIDKVPCPKSLLMSYRNEIHSLLEIREDLLLIAKQRIDAELKQRNLNTNNITLVSAHVRRTDYLEYIKNKKLTMPTELYYRSAFQFYRKNCENVVLVVLSDDPEWVKENLSFSNVIFPGNGKISSPEVDFAIISLCHHHIVGLGSFGFTSAFVNHGSFVVFNQRVNNDTPEEDIVSGLTNKTFSCSSSEMILL